MSGETAEAFFRKKLPSQPENKRISKFPPIPDAGKPGKPRKRAVFQKMSGGTPKGKAPGGRAGGFLESGIG
jgi:hypothetical protein